MIVASDNVYLYENLDLGVPIAATQDAESNLRAQNHMRKLAGNWSYSFQATIPLS